MKTEYNYMVDKKKRKQNTNHNHWMEFQDLEDDSVQN